MSAFASQFEAIITRVAAGEPLTATLRALSLPGKSGFDAWLRRHPDLRARLDAARPLSGQALVRAKFDNILAAIRDGATAEGAVESFGGTGTSFFKVIKSDKALKARFVAATASREDGENAIGKSATGRWSEADFTRALDALRAEPKVGMQRVLTDGYPTPFLVLDKARRDPAFRERLVAVVGERAKRRTGLRKAAPRVYEDGLLRRALLQLDLFRIANKTFAGLDPADREDCTSEAICAALDGEITIDEIKTKGRKLARARVFGSVAWPVSLDAPHFDTRNAEPLGALLATPCPIVHY
ncbi:hypothetical protein [Bradyrhizobium manausense]|uniref:Uncharacterized protein n=1 Tax=Bradyrhizobium manausense TaxID=989370 RepID=A0A0R3D0A8_9BRAD|nr:hypothetical protein [Bradyrhizobium manausense]KRQ03089.1 hypothetical protein AOQ71_30460 [Bradyrhizobium manausense]